MDEQSDKRLAYALARLGLGINIAIHGWSRIPHFADFAKHLHEQFATTFLPAPIIQLTAYVIVAAESTIGPLIILGLFLRAALTAGSLLICMLLFGTCLVQNWSVAGDQLVYLAFFTALLALRKFDAWSIDSLRLRSGP